MAKPEYPNYYPDRKHYVKPHIWDQWTVGDFKQPQKIKYIKPNAPNMDVAETPRVITVSNAWGEEISLDPSRTYTQDDWKKKVLTLDCSICPFHISGSEADSVLRARPDKISGTPISSMGLCLFGLSGKFHLRRILVQGKGPISNCSIPREDRYKREQFKRKIGLLPL